MILSNTVESSSPNDEKNQTEMSGSGNTAMADALRKVLQMGKNMETSSLVLAKAKLHSEENHTKKAHDPGFEVAETANEEVNQPIPEENVDNEDIKPDSKSLVKLRKIKKVDIAARGRLKPSPLDREKERPLMKIASRGVVQLFNAVREQQKFIVKKMDEGRTEAQKEKILKSVNKKTFLDVLRGQATTQKRSSLEPEVKTEEEDNVGDDQPGWSVLHKDFMMGAKLKDWNDEATEKEPDVKRPRLKVSS